MNSNGVFVVLPQARADLLEITRFLASRNPTNAANFVHAARESFEELAQSPFLGSPQFFSHPAHSLRRGRLRVFVPIWCSTGLLLPRTAWKSGACCTPRKTSCRAWKKWPRIIRTRNSAPHRLPKHR